MGHDLVHAKLWNLPILQVMGHDLVFNGALQQYNSPQHHVLLQQCNGLKAPNKANSLYPKSQCVYPKSTFQSPKQSQCLYPKSPQLTVSEKQRACIRKATCLYPKSRFCLYSHANQTKVSVSEKQRACIRKALPNHPRLSRTLTSQLFGCTMSAGPRRYSQHTSNATHILVAVLDSMNVKT